ncbi:MAG: hypothetical protein ACK5QD_11880 [Brevundimonas sp.]|uniref:hypothetical protein n=1 Tax=Brevundimonas sp. TaxID=1871086 RepID=UPI00391A325A
MKKFVLGLALAAAAVAGPAAASDPYSHCLLRSGCFILEGAWVCPDPGMFMLCVD